MYVGTHKLDDSIRMPRCINFIPIGGMCLHIIEISRTSEHVVEKLFRRTFFVSEKNAQNFNSTIFFHPLEFYTGVNFFVTCNKNLSLIFCVGVQVQ